MGRGRPRPGVLSDSTAFYGDEPSPPRSLTFLNSPSPRNGAHLDTTTGTQPSGCRGVSIAPWCSVNAAFLFAEPRMLVVVSRCARCKAGAFIWLALCEIECNLPNMDWGRYLKVWKDPWLKIAPLLIVASAQAEVVPWPLTGSAVAGEGALRLKCVNNLLQIKYAARRFANDAGHFPSSFQELTNYLDS